MLGARTVSIALIPQGVALTTRAIFDNITNEQAATVGFWSLAAILLALAVTRSFIIFGNVVLSVRVEFTFATLLRKNVFDHVLDQPGNQALPESTGEAVTRFREDIDYITRYLQRFGFALPLLVFAAVALYIMVQISPLITFAVFMPLALVMVTVSAATRWLRRFRIDNRKSTGDVTSLLGEMFGSVEAIKVANAEGRMLGELKRLNSRRKTYTIRDTLLTQALNSVFQNTVTIGTGLVLLIAASAMRSGSFTIGDFALFVSYLYTVGWLNTEVGGVLAEYRQTGVSFDRLEGLMTSAAPGSLVRHQRAHITGPLPEVPYTAKTDAHRLDLVEVDGLTYRYGGNGRGIEGIRLRVPRGSFTVVTGRVGSGKTTLLKVLLGLLPRDAGEVRWNGEPVDDLAAFFIPRARRTPPRCRDSSASPSETTYSWACPGTGPIWMALSTPRSWSATSRRWRTAWTPWSARAASSCPAANSGARRRPGCSCATRSYSSSTTCRRASTWTRSRSFGTASLTGATPPRSWYPTAEPRSDAPITS